MNFEELYNVYYMQVYSYVMTIVKDAHSAEEVTQEVFYKALKTNSYQGKSSEFTWLCSIAKNTCIDHMRKRSKVRQTELEDDFVDSHNFVQNLVDESTTLVIHQILHEMEEPYKEVFQLRIFGELSFEKIGTIFGKTENWARVTYHRAKLKLQEKLERNE